MATSASSSSPPLRLPMLFSLRPSGPSNSVTTALLSLPSAPPAASFSCRRPLLLLTSPQKIRRGCRVSAAAEDVLSSAADPQQQVVIPSGAGDGVFNVISVLLFAAFLGLSVLTIGVVYIGVTDFLQKREREKFDKEEEAKKKKKGGKKGKVKFRARAGARGFGQKINADDNEDDELVD